MEEAFGLEEAREARRERFCCMVSGTRGGDGVVKAIGKRSLVRSKEEQNLVILVESKPWQDGK